MSRYAGAITMLIFGLSVSVPLSAVETEKAVGPHPVIDQVFARYEKAFNASDSKAIGALWKEDGEFVNALGERIAGREAVEKLFDDYFSRNAGVKLSIKVLSIKQQEGGNVAVAEILPELNPPPPDRPGTHKATVVLIRSGDKWEIEGVKETPHLAVAYEHLKALDWLVGSWSTQQPAGPESEKTSRIIISSNCHWTRNKSFLIRTFATRMEQLEFHGTEFIGWDPQAKTIRSWLFESSGGFTQSTWKEDGNTWTIEMKGVLAGGDAVGSTTTLTKIDADTIAVDAKNRMRGGKPLPDISQLKLHRVKQP